MNFLVGWLLSFLSSGHKEFISDTAIIDFDVESSLNKSFE